MQRINPLNVCNVADKRLLFTFSHTHTHNCLCAIKCIQVVVVCCNVTNSSHNSYFHICIICILYICIILQMCSSCMTAASRYQNSIGKEESLFQIRAVNFYKSAGFYRLGRINVTLNQHQYSVTV